MILLKTIEKPITIEKGDDFKAIFSKYGCLAFDRQENLSELIGDLVGEIDLENGTLTFSDDIKFDIQILGFFTEEFNQWSWAWDNENIGFDDEFIKAAREIYEIGAEYEIPEFTTPVFETKFDDCHIWAMTASALLDMDAYYAANVEGLDIFVAIKSDSIKRNDSVVKFRDTFNTFQKNFSVYPRLAFEGYTKLKGYEFKNKDDFAVAKLGEDRIIAGFTERGNLTHLQMLTVD